MVKGIDVSCHRGTIDWAKAKAAGVEFAILRMGYGSNITDTATGDWEQDDSQFAANVEGCEANGIPWGGYIYSYATDLDKAESEVQHALRLLAGKKPSYPIYIDMEDADGYKAARGVSNDMCVQICELFCRRMTESGYCAGIYANKDWFENRLNDSRLDGFDKWIAQWNDSITYSGSFAFQLWQNADNGAVDGINGNVDMDQTVGDVDYPARMQNDHLNGWGNEEAVATVTAAAEASSSYLSVGDTLHYSGLLYGDSYGHNPGASVDGDFTLDIVKADGRLYGYHIPAGWIEIAACTSATASNPYACPDGLIRNGDRGDGVKWLQTALNLRGKGLTLDGIFGAKTLAAVQAFQSENGLTVDGIVGDQTKAALNA